MLSKYKATLFHLCCAIAFSLGLFLLYPFFSITYPKEEKAHTQSPIIHKKSKTTLWKNGSFASTTTISEDLATTKNLKEMEHTSKGWVTIHWKKDKKGGTSK
ncbi:hypothetical protein K0U07_04485 [bacterium]|nr:hypothetical protein [bacterium]